MNTMPAAVEMAAQLPGRKVSRAERTERTRQLLLASAWEVLAERGYQATTLEEVAERAGFTRRPIYSLFGSKEQLALALYQQFISHNIDLVEDIKPGKSLAATLTQYADLATEVSRRREFKPQLELASTLIALSQNDAEIRAPMAAMLERNHARLTSWLEDCADASGEGFRIPVKHVALIISAAIQGLLQNGTIEIDSARPHLKREVVLALIA